MDKMTEECGENTVETHVKNQKQGKVMEKNKEKRKLVPGFLFALIGFSVAFLFLIVNFLMQDRYAFTFDCMWLKNDADIEVTVDWLMNLYTDFLLALLGIYFTIIGISFSLKQISILVFYEFTFFTKTSLATLIIFVLNVVSIYCVLPNLRLTNAVVVYVFLSIVFCITVFCYFSSRIFYTDDEEWVRQLFYSVFRKRNPLINKFVNEFLLKSFGKESPFVFFNINDSNSDTNAIFFELINIDEINDLKEMENFMIVVSSKIKECINKLDEDKQAEICIKYITAFDKFYRHYLFKLHSDTSFILNIRDAFWFAENSAESENFFKLYAAACERVKNIILSSFYQKTDETIFAYLNDYRYLNQFPRLYDNEKFNIFFNRTLVEISTYMFAIVIVGKHSNKIIPYAEKLFLSIEKIDVDCMMPVMHEEGNFAKMGSYKVKYTQEFLVALILLYLMAKDCDFDIKKILKNKIRFVNYSFNKDENHLNLLKTGYSRFKSCVEKITVEEINNVKPISENDFRNTKEKFISLLDSEIKGVNEKDKEELNSINFDGELKNFVKNEKDRLQDDLKEWFSKVGDDATYKENPMPVEYSFLFSKKAYREHNEVVSAGSFSDLIREWFVPMYISHSNLKYFKMFSELNSENDTDLLLHIDYMAEVLDDKTIELGVGCFRANGKEFKTTYFRTGKRGLIYQNDFKRHFAVKEIIPLMDQTETEERDDDILVSVPVKVVFCELDENPDFWILSK
ncbi:MAG: hypothetical protein HDR54_01920 [Treponema sp.]|nr:hypothetical protein [Treponema sp.]